MEIVRERLEREFDLSLIATAPSVAYRAYLNDGTMVDVDNPSELPEPTALDHVDEPMLRATILTPAEYIGSVMDLCQSRRGEMLEDGVPVAGAGGARLRASPWPRWS